MRHRRLLFTVVAGLAIAACGSTASTSSSNSSGATGTSTSSGASGSSTTSAGKGGAGASATAQMISASEASTVIPGLEQASDGKLGGIADTVQRVFAPADRSFAIELDLVVDSKPNSSAGLSGEASTDYPQFDSTAKKQVANVTDTKHPSLGDSAAEYVGDDGSGNGAMSIAFVKGSVIVVVTAKAKTGTLDVAKIEALTALEAQKVTG
jgi:hypothetical protein